MPTRSRQDKKTAPRLIFAVSPELQRRVAEITERRGISITDFLVRATENQVKLDELALTKSEVPEVLEAILMASAKFKDRYQKLVGAWRAERAKSQVEEIANHKQMVLDQASPEVYLLRILTPLLDNLGSESEFIVRTTSDFWEKAAQDPIRSPKTLDNYFTAQREALRRGMRLQRVVLLGEHEDESKLEVHRAFKRTLERAWLPQVRLCFKRVTGFTGPLVCIRNRSEASLSASLKEQDEACLVIHTDPSQDHSSILDLQFRFSAGPSSESADVRTKLVEVYNALNGATAIE